MDNQPLFIVLIILVLFFIYKTSTKPVKKQLPHYQLVHPFNPMKPFYDHKYWG